MKRQSYKCSILENGRIIIFGNVEAMANYLKVCPQKMRRWRRALVKANTPLVRNCGTVYIDFAPEQYINIMKRKKYSKYKYVCFAKVGTRKQTDRWTAQMRLPNGKQWTKKCKTERGAAIAADKQLIEMGREPINILKRK